MTTLNRFRIVKLADDLQKEYGLPKLICADPDGLPFWEGGAFYTWVIENACEPATACNYLNAVLPFLTFLWNGPPSLQYTAPVEQIRNRVRDYLKERLGCHVLDTESLSIERTGPSPTQSKSSWLSLAPQ